MRWPFGGQVYFGGSQKHISRQIPRQQREEGILLKVHGRFIQGRVNFEKVPSTLTGFLFYWWCGLLFYLYILQSGGRNGERVKCRPFLERNGSTGYSIIWTWYFFFHLSYLIWRAMESNWKRHLTRVGKGLSSTWREFRTLIGCNIWHGLKKDESHFNWSGWFEHVFE